MTEASLISVEIKKRRERLMDRSDRGTTLQRKVSTEAYEPGVANEEMRNTDMLQPCTKSGMVRFGGALHPVGGHLDMKVKRYERI
jgi:hypothetical protein